MPCIQPPHFPPLPNILPLTLTPPTLPPIDLSIDFCCRLDLTIPLPQIPLGPLVIAVPGFAATMALINGYITAANSVIDALPLSCPFETG